MGRPQTYDPFGQFEDERNVLIDALVVLKRRGSKIAAQALDAAQKIGTGFVEERLKCPK